MTDNNSIYTGSSKSHRSSNRVQNEGSGNINEPLMNFPSALLKPLHDNDRKRCSRSCVITKCIRIAVNI